MRNTLLTCNLPSLMPLLKACARATRPRWSEYKIRACEPTTCKRIENTKYVDSVSLEITLVLAKNNEKRHFRILISDALTRHEIFPQFNHPQTFPQKSAKFLSTETSYQLMLLCLLDPFQVVFILSFHFGWHYRQQTKKQKLKQCPNSR